MKCGRKTNFHKRKATQTKTHWAGCRGPRVLVKLSPAPVCGVRVWHRHVLGRGRGPTAAGHLEEKKNPPAVAKQEWGLIHT